MAKFNIDFTDAKEFNMCGKGEHNFKITQAEIKDYIKDGEARQKIELTCEVFGGTDSGAKIFYSIFLKNPTGLFMFMNRIGAKVEKRNYVLDTNTFIGKLFVANVETESYTKSDGTTGTKAVIVDTSIRKYVQESTYNDLDYEDDISINNDDIPFE